MASTSMVPAFFLRTKDCVVNSPVEANAVFDILQQLKLLSIYTKDLFDEFNFKNSIVDRKF